MTRLIDADKIPYVDDETYFHEFDYAYRYAIDAVPTVEAIPIKWIVNYVNSYADRQKEITEDVAYIEVLGVTESMIADWRIENYGKAN